MKIPVSIESIFIDKNRNVRIRVFPAVIEADTHKDLIKKVTCERKSENGTYIRHINPAMPEKMEDENSLYGEIVRKRTFYMKDGKVLVEKYGIFGYDLRNKKH